MDFDFVVGSAADEKNLALRNLIMAAGPGAGPHRVVTPSPLAGIETILAKIGAGGHVGCLRVFNCISGAAGVSFLSSQLVRLQGRFADDGSVEIFTPSS